MWYKEAINLHAEKSTTLTSRQKNTCLFHTDNIYNDQSYQRCSIIEEKVETNKNKWKKFRIRS